MNPKNNKASKSSMTPLWVISLFLSLTEVVTGFAVIQASGAIQVALTAFVIAFPILVALAFFSILWNRPHVLYPPTEFAGGADIESYVNAIRRQGRQTGAALEMAEKAIESPEIKATLKSVLSKSGPAEQAQIDHAVSEVSKTAREMIRRNVLSIDISRITHKQGSALLQPYDPSQTVSELLDGLYLELAEFVEPMTYGKHWALRDIETQAVLKSLGRLWALRRGERLDSRSLSEVGFHAGMRLEAVLL
jgi:hypothetical protein